jgi:hypothetical protein
MMRITYLHVYLGLNGLAGSNKINPVCYYVLCVIPSAVHTSVCTVHVCKALLFKAVCVQRCGFWGSIFMLKLSVYHPGVFTELYKMAFTSQTHLLFVLNVLFGPCFDSLFYVRA